jgi:hypothetical protein
LTLRHPPRSQPPKPSGAQTNSRNDYRSRARDTRAGTVEPAIPTAGQFGVYRPGLDERGEDMFASQFPAQGLAKSVGAYMPSSLSSRGDVNRTAPRCPLPPMRHRWNIRALIRTGLARFLPVLYWQLEVPLRF